MEKRSPFSKYDGEETCQAILEMGEKGYHVYEMCWALGVHHKTLYNWAKEYPEFNTAFEKAKDFSKGWLIRQARENFGNRDFQPKLTELVWKFYHDMRDRPMVNMPGFNEAKGWKAKASCVLEALGDQRITPEEAERVMNTIKGFILAENSEEFKPFLEQMKEVAKQHQHERSQ